MHRWSIFRVIGGTCPNCPEKAVAVLNSAGDEQSKGIVEEYESRN